MVQDDAEESAHESPNAVISSPRIDGVTDSGMISDIAQDLAIWQIQARPYREGTGMLSHHRAYLDLSNN